MNLHLRHLKNKSHRSHGNSIVLLTALVALVLFGLQIWLSGEIATAGQQINTYEMRKQELVNEHARLQEMYNSLSSLDSIEEKAKELGLVRVDPSNIHYVSTLDSLASLFQQ